MTAEGTIPKAPIPGTPVLQEAKMHLVMPAAPGVGVVVSNERCTASGKSAGFIRHLVVDVSKTAIAGNFICGQSFGVIPPGVDAHGKPHKLRLYSIASPSFGEDGEGKVLSTTVKRTIDEHHDTGKLFLGVASNFLCDTKPGDAIKVTGPNGKRFALPKDLGAHDYVFFATGTGIAPFRGMLMELFARKVSSRVVLVMGSPYATDLLYDKELRAWEEEHPNFTYLTALSREKHADAPAMYCHERIRHSRDAILPVVESERGLVYICGVAGMELGVFQRLATELKGSVREQYLAVDSAAMENVTGWTRKMIHKQVNPTRRVFLEVYD
jgi:ferredoxin--NADP+ reductase